MPATKRSRTGTVILSRTGGPSDVEMLEAVSKAERDRNKVATIASVKRLIGRHKQNLRYDVISGGTAGVPKKVDLNGMMVPLLDLPNISGVGGKGTGNQVTLRRMVLRLLLAASQAQGRENYDPWATCRIVIFRWRPNTVPTIDDVMQRPPLNTAERNEPAVYTYQYESRTEYDILFDRCVHIGGTLTFPGVAPGDRTFLSGASAPGEKLVTANLFGKKLGAKTVKYENLNTDGYNKPYMLLLSDAGAGNDTAPEVKFVVETHYEVDS